MTAVRGDVVIIEPSFGQRTVARAVDMVLIVVLTVPLRLAVTGRVGILVSVVAIVVYEGLMTLWFGATAGKLLFGTRIRRDDGTSVSGLRAALRIGVLLLGALAVALLRVPGGFAAGWIIVLGVPAMVGPAHKGIHDRVAGTIVAAVEVPTVR
jgi:uncharacterized RDD family membrane protein YckC